VRSGQLRVREPVRTLALVLVATTLSACAPDPEPEAEPRAAEPVVGALPSRTEFVDNGLLFVPEDRASLQVRLGPPDSVSQKVIANRHVPGVRDTIFIYHYPQMTVGFHHPGGGRDLLSSVEVRSNDHLRYPLLGLTRDAIDGAFGAPDEASDSSLTYYCTSCIAGDDPVEIVFVNGEARRVRFSYYVD